MSQQWIQEAALLAAHLMDRVGDTLAQVDYLDRHQDARLALEYTLPGNGGMVYEEVEDHTQGDTLPFHIRTYRTQYLRRIPGAFPQVQDLLVILKDLYSSPGATAEAGLEASLTWFDKATDREANDAWVRKHGPTIPKHTDEDMLIYRAKALFKMTMYFKGLVEALPEVTDGGMTQLADSEISSGPLNYRDYIAPRPTCYAIVDGRRDEDVEFEGDPEFYDLFQSDAKGTGAMMRKRLIHNPYAPDVPDWLLRQPKLFKSLYFGVREIVDTKGVDGLRDTLLKHTQMDESKRPLSRLHLKLCWERYRSVRDRIRAKEAVWAERHLGDFTKRVIKRIDASIYFSTRDLEREKWHLALSPMGKRLYEWGSGQRPWPKDRTIPGPELTVVWDIYRKKKAELLEPNNVI